MMLHHGCATQPCFEDTFPGLPFLSYLIGEMENSKLLPRDFFLGAFLFEKWAMPSLGARV